MIKEIIDYISNWQSENDKDFKTLPIDNHSSIIINMGNKEFKFIFSNKYKRDECRINMPIEYLEKFSYMIEQENGFTFYIFNLEGD